VVNVFAQGKDERDEADFLLWVMLCRRAIEAEKDGGGGGVASPGLAARMRSSFTSEDGNMTLGGLGKTNRRDAQKEQAEAMQKSLNRFANKVSRQVSKVRR
jgi:hypothetical protein